MTDTFRRSLTIAVLTLTVSGLHAQDEYPPGTFQLTPQVDLQLQPVPVYVPEPFRDLLPQNPVLHLPPGFSVKVFAATGLRGPRFMAWSPEGVLHVANMKAGQASQFGARIDSRDPPALSDMEGQIVALPDRDGDGVADAAIVVAENLWWAHSLEFYEGDMYVADSHAIRRFRPDPDLGGYRELDPLVEGLPSGPQHRTRTLIFDRVDTKLYVSIGSTCDLCREDNPERATIIQLSADGTGRRVFARGLRNGIGLALHPVTNELWATNNGHDREGAALPPEWIDIVRDGGFYGWPLAYGFRVPVNTAISQYADAILPLSVQDSLDVESMQRPVALLNAHLAPMDLHFYDHDAFPRQYRNAGFATMRAGAMGLVPGYKVVALFAEPDGSNARVGDFLLGLQPNYPEDRGLWGKPVGVTTDEHGYLYVSSDWIRHFILKILPYRLDARSEPQLPAEALTGDRISVAVDVLVTERADDGGPVTASADLSDFGGPADVILQDTGDGTFPLRTVLETGTRTGVRVLTVNLRQQVPGDVLITSVRWQVAVLPGEDRVLLDDALAPGWTPRGSGGVELVEISGAGPVFAGAAAAMLSVERASALGWNFSLLAPEPVPTLGYPSLRFAFHPGTVDPPGSPRLLVRTAPGGLVDILDRVDLGRKQWQTVELAMPRLNPGEFLETFHLSGNFEGTFYVDDVRLITGTPRSATAVLADQEAVPTLSSLDQNYPNPFNAETVIRFQLQTGGAVALTVFNLSGQRVATLFSGRLNAGLHSQSWNGRDIQGRQLASGAYLYRLEVDGVVTTRKMLLMR